MAIIVLATGIVLLVLGSIEIGPAVSAAEGKGIHGYFIARIENCTKSHRCSWSGDFRLPDGTVTRTSVEFIGDDPGIVQDSVIPAVDSGSPFSVYQVNGAGQWLGPAGELVLGVLLMAAFVLLLVRRRRSGT